VHFLTLPGESKNLQTPPLSALSLLHHELLAENTFRLQLVVRATPQSNSIHAGDTTAGDRLDVIELKEPPLFTPMPALADERAPALIAFPYGASHMRGHVPRPARKRSRSARLESGSELPPFELLDQQVERAIENLSDVSAWNHMAE